VPVDLDKCMKPPSIRQRDVSGHQRPPSGRNERRAVRARRSASLRPASISRHTIPAGVASNNRKVVYDASDPAHRLTARAMTPAAAALPWRTCP